MRRSNLALRIGLLVASMASIASEARAGDEFPAEWYFDGVEKLRAMEGKPAPVLELDAWIGEETSLEKLKGRVVVVDFWATWCGPCMAAIPENVELMEKHEKAGLSFLGVHDSNSGWDRAPAVVTEKKINYPVARDAGGKSVKNYSLSFWPTYVVIDRHGVVRAAGLQPKRVGEVVKKLLAEPGPAIAAARGTSEFPDEWYFGGAKRFSHQKALEGTVAAPLALEGWHGEAIAGAGEKGRVTAMLFIAPWSRRAVEAVPAWNELAATLGRQGAAVLAICDHYADWDALPAWAEEHGAAFAIARDASPGPDAKMRLGATAAAYGVRVWPACVVIDRKGVVRAVGLDPAHAKAVVEKLMAEPG